MTANMKQRSGNTLPNNLPQLQNLSKRDPISYRDEFIQQWRCYQSYLEIFRLQPTTTDSDDFSAMALFIAHLAHLYTDIASSFPDELTDLLKNHYAVMEPGLRRSLVQALMLLRNKDLISCTAVLELSFTLFRCADKNLRQLLHSHIVSDVKSMNAKSKNNKLNKTLQNYMYTMLSDPNPIAAKKSLDVMIELYCKKIWNDSKTVNVVVEACFNPVAKIQVTAMQFFLGKAEQGMEEEHDADEDNAADAPDSKALLRAETISKSSAKRKRKLKKAIDSIKKKNDRSGKGHKVIGFAALQLVNDPQGFCDRMFRDLRATNARLEVRLMMMDLISRLIGSHELMVLNFYPYMQKFLQPQQRECTRMLIITAQAAHTLVPPDVMSPLLLTIANNFISERCSPEAMTIGLNAVREICSRCPLAMEEDLLHDLAQYNTYKNKNVSAASKSLIQLYRIKDPSMLARKDRGRPEDEDDVTGGGTVTGAYGEEVVAQYVPGAELLGQYDDHIEEERELGVDVDTMRAEEEAGWETGSDGDFDGEWVTVNQDDAINIDCSDDDDDEANNNNTVEKKSKQELKVEAEKNAALLREKAKDVSRTRLLTQEDFERIKRLRVDRQLQSVTGKKRKLEVLHGTPADGLDPFLKPSEIIESSAIESLSKRLKQDKESRMASIAEGREGRREYGSGKGHHHEDKAGMSTTNAVKAKGKNFLMVAHSRRVREKKKLSGKDKNFTQKKHAKGQKKKWKA